MERERCSCHRGQTWTWEKYLEQTIGAAAKIPRRLPALREMLPHGVDYCQRFLDGSPVDRSLANDRNGHSDGRSSRQPITSEESTCSASADLERQHSF